jgi:hypothetical protein
MRLKHLLYDRKFTLEGAREELFQEQSAGGAATVENEMRRLFNELRSDLLDVYFSNKHY